MKTCTSVRRVRITSIITLAVALGVPWHSAFADDSTPNSAPVTVVTPSPAPSTAAQIPPLPFGVTETVKMYQGGISKDVIVSYIQNTALPFHLTADGIIYLKHIGVPEEVTSALIKRDGELSRQAVMAAQLPQVGAQPPMAAAAPSPVVVMPSSPAPAVNPYPDVVSTPPVVYPDYSVYPYYYPYYGPDVVITGGFGWGWGSRGWGWGPGFGHGGFGHGGGFGHSGGFGHR